MRYVRGRLHENRIRIPVGIRAFDLDPSGSISLTYHPFTALVDTGATRTSVSRNVVDRVGLTSQGKIPVGNVKRTEEHHTYLFYVGVWPETGDGLPPSVFGIGNEIMGIDGGDSRYWDVLLGMDIISQGTLQLRLDGTFDLGFPG